MGHGDEWEAVEKDTSTFLETMVALICKQGKFVGENSFCHTMPELEKKEGEVFGLQYPVPESESAISFLALGVRHIQEGENMLWTAYPLCAEGPCTRLVVDEVK